MRTRSAIERNPDAPQRLIASDGFEPAEQGRRKSIARDSRTAHTRNCEKSTSRPSEGGAPSAKRSQWSKQVMSFLMDMRRIRRSIRDRVGRVERSRTTGRPGLGSLANYGIAKKNPQ